MRIKICGITRPDQGYRIADLGATALGFICVPASPRYVTPAIIQSVIEQVKTLSKPVDLVGVFANADRADIKDVLRVAHLTAIQLHGKESPEFCKQIKELFPDLELIKAFAIRNQEDVTRIHSYTKVVDTLLLDAYHPQLLGGTGDTLPWDELVQFTPPLPWLLAGGLKPDNVAEALGQLRPDGIDLSSGVERSPGDKNLELVNQLFTVLHHLSQL